MSDRVRAVATAIGLILRSPTGRAELALLHAQLGYWQAKTLARLVTSPRRRDDPSGRMLTVEEAAAICGRSKSFLYERAVDLGFGCHQNGARGLRICERKLRLWMEG